MMILYFFIFISLFFMSQIVLYISHNTLVLFFHIDVVLTLSMTWKGLLLLLYIIIKKISIAQHNTVEHVYIIWCYLPNRNIHICAIYVTYLDSDHRQASAVVTNGLGRRLSGIAQRNPSSHYHCVSQLQRWNHLWLYNVSYDTNWRNGGWQTTEVCRHL